LPPFSQDLSSTRATSLCDGRSGEKSKWKQSDLGNCFSATSSAKIIDYVELIYSITAGTASASAVLTHYEFSLLQVCFRHSADAGRLVVGIFLDDAGEATEFFKAWLLPLCNQFCICVLFLEQIVVELS
jgi:hypothetical protein